MAYVSKELTKKVRGNLKKQFPQFKFSVKTNPHKSTLYVTFKSGNVDFSEIYSEQESEYVQINKYHLSNYPKKFQELFQNIIDIMNVDNWDKSDIQADYFDVGYYISLRVGEWDKEYLYKA